MTAKDINTPPTGFLLCPFCGSGNVLSVGFSHEGRTAYRVNCCNCGARGPKSYDDDEVIALWNNRAAIPPKRHPADVLTGRDRRNIGAALFQNDIHVEHVLPLHAAPCQMRLHGGWEALGEALREWDAGQLEEILPIKSETLEYGGDEELLCALRQVGGWVVMGSYATVGKIELNEEGKFSSCSVYCGIERVFLVWGETYKQAIAKAINEQRRYFQNEVRKAREARHGA